MWNKLRKSGQQRPNNSAGNVVPNSKLTSLILITDLSINVFMHAYYLQALSLQYHQMIQASFQALAHGNPHHAPTLNEQSFLSISNLLSKLETQDLDQIKFPEVLPHRLSRSLHRLSII